MEKIGETEIERALYNARDHRFDHQLSTRYSFDVALTLDDNDDPAYRVLITRIGGGVIAATFAYSLDDVQELVSEWWAQLEAGSRPLDMGANR